MSFVYKWFHSCHYMSYIIYNYEWMVWHIIMVAMCVLHVRNFKFFILGLLLSCFLFYHVQVFFFPFSLHFFKKIIKHIKVIQCQGKWTWITWGDKFMEFGSHHHTCFLQLQVYKNSFPFFYLFSLYQYISSFISSPCYL
jgi:hypothetical protein